MSDTLAKCPWPRCGWAVGDEAKIKAGVVRDGQYGWAVLCGCCGMRGPIVLGRSSDLDAHERREEAAKRWNELTR
jgi:hypothetical protein